MSDTDKAIQKIIVNKPNFEYIIETGTINGSLLVDIRDLINQETADLKQRNEQLEEALESLLKQSLDGISEFQNLKHKYPRVSTIQIIDLLKRLKEQLRTAINDNTINNK